jgi:non-specific serine/threonine protein kinase
VTLLPPVEISRRLDSRLPLVARGMRTAQPRQQTLRASLDWSFDLLSGSEAALFQRLAVFAGGWTMEAAEVVCSGDQPGIEDVLGTLGQLVDKSLVHVDTTVPRGRYRFLEVVRQYAHEKLQCSGELARVSAQHAAYFVNLAAQATSELSGPPSSERQVDLESEHDNLRATVRWVLANADVAAAHMLGTDLARFSQIGNYLTEGRAWLADILALSDEPTAGRARTLIGAGLLGAYTFAYTCLSDGVGLCRALGEDRELAHGLFALGLMAWSRGDHAAAGRFGEEGLAVSRRAGHRGFEALHLFICAAAAAEAGDRDAPRRLAEQCHALATHARCGRDRSVAGRAGAVALLRGRVSDSG